MKLYEVHVHVKYPNYIFAYCDLFFGTTETKSIPLVKYKLKSSKKSLIAIYDMFLSNFSNSYKKDLAIVMAHFIYTFEFIFVKTSTYMYVSCGKISHTRIL